MDNPSTRPRIEPETSGSFEMAVRRSAAWFYWVAGLSVVNMIMMATGSNYSMVLGSGLTQLSQSMAQSFWAEGDTPPAMALYALTLLFPLVFVFFGWKAGKLVVWPFIVGMVLYALDSLVFVLASDWVGIGFHVFVLFMLYRGLSNLRLLHQARGE